MTVANLTLVHSLNVAGADMSAQLQAPKTMDVLRERKTLEPMAVAAVSNDDVI